MGYESTIEEMPKIKKESIKKVRRDIKSFSKENSETRADWKWFFDDTTINKDGTIEQFEYTGKFYDTEKVALYLADKVEKGILEFTGEDGAKWGFEFDGKGKAYLLIYKKKRGVELKDYAL